VPVFINHNITVGNKTDKKTGELIPLDTSQYVNLPIPEKGKEGLISLGYVWSNKRPHAWNSLHPTQGYGLLAEVNYANKNLFGNFSYTRFKTDMYANIPIGKTALYFRLKTMMYSGQPPAQSFLGLTDDEPIYISGIGPSEFLPENHNPRGWSGHRLGDKLIYGSLEYRLPIAPKTASVNLISDFGNAWSADKEKEKQDNINHHHKSCMADRAGGYWCRPVLGYAAREKKFSVYNKSGQNQACPSQRCSSHLIPVQHPNKKKMPLLLPFHLTRP
jgi:hypothetical protein